MQLIIKKTHEDAVTPKRAHDDDAGYDLYATHLIKECKGGIIQVGTGIHATIDTAGYHLEAVARSSLHKRGYALANSIGLIDQGYQGEICLILAPLWSNPDPLEFPAKIAQLIIRKTEVADAVNEVAEFDKKTLRHTGGFGSTGH